MARNEMILKTLAQILMLVAHLCLRGSMEEHTTACLETFFCPDVRDVMLSLCGLQSVDVVYFFTVLRAYKLTRLLAIDNKKAENYRVVTYKAYCNQWLLVVYRQ